MKQKEENKGQMTLQEAHQALLDAMKETGSSKVSMRTDHGDHYFIVTVSSKASEEEGEDEE